GPRRRQRRARRGWRVQEARGVHDPRWRPDRFLSPVTPRAPGAGGHSVDAGRDVLGLLRSPGSVGGRVQEDAEMGFRVIVAVALFVGTSALLLPTPSSAQGPRATFRVCADPNNLPYSNDRLEGFENKIVQLIAGEFGATPTFTWWPDRRGFIRNTLRANQCDVVMGIPNGYDQVRWTQPYYRSTYAFVYARDREFRVRSWDDPALRKARI